MSLKLTYSKKEEETTADFMENEEALWKAFRQGEKKALSMIYQQHFFKLYNYGMKVSPDRELVKDCIQELFVYIWKSRATLSHTSSIKYYLFRSLRRKMVEEIRKTNRIAASHQRFQEFSFELPHEQKIIAEQLSAEKAEKLLSCLNKLPKRQKEALFLRYYENLSPQEVSSIMGLSIESTYVLFSKAISLLRKNLLKLVSIGLPLLLMLRYLSLV